VAEELGLVMEEEAVKDPALALEHLGADGLSPGGRLAPRRHALFADIFHRVRQ